MFSKHVTKVRIVKTLEGFPTWQHGPNFDWQWRDFERKHCAQFFHMSKFTTNSAFLCQGGEALFWRCSSRKNSTIEFWSDSGLNKLSFSSVGSSVRVIFVYTRAVTQTSGPNLRRKLKRSRRMGVFAAKHFFLLPSWLPITEEGRRRKKEVFSSLLCFSFIYALRKMEAKILRNLHAKNISSPRNFPFLYVIPCRMAKTLGGRPACQSVLSRPSAQRGNIVF